MVSSAIAGAHSPAHHRTAAARNRTGDHGRILRFPQPLAAPRAGWPTARRGWHVADYPPAPGVGIRGGGVGVRNFAVAHRALPARVSGPALSLWRSHLGPAFTAPGI